MAALRWSPKAYEDLAEIKRYVEQENPQAAKRLIEEILESAQRLEQFPLSGPLLRHKRWEKDTMRFLVIGKYLLFYEYDAAHVSIYRVLYGKRNYRLLLLELAK